MVFQLHPDDPGRSSELNRIEDQVEDCPVQKIRIPWNPNLPIQATFEDPHAYSHLRMFAYKGDAVTGDGGKIHLSGLSHPQYGELDEP